MTDVRRVYISAAQFSVCESEDANASKRVSACRKSHAMRARWAEEMEAGGPQTMLKSGNDISTKEGLVLCSSRREGVRPPHTKPRLEPTREPELPGEDILAGSSDPPGAGEA